MGNNECTGSFDKLRDQFNRRSDTFDTSANWITDSRLISAHVELSGLSNGALLEICCGTGRVGRALKEKGWEVTGLDICDSMLEKAGKYFSARNGKAEELPFGDASFSAVVCRQSFQFLDSMKVLGEVKRVLRPKGVFVMSLTVPFSDKDKDWLRHIHKTKQPLLLKFYDKETLARELERYGFRIEEERTLTVRESINKWMEFAPELSSEVKNNVISLVRDSPPEYKELHNVGVVKGEVFEDWNWVVFRAGVAERA
ncbi:MAG: methyltransferase domain-containing protein [Candidatus Omnitrophica bacterium]|nr:methyltransferase domain-containing protein [Candidatus Omnitrophota bacterium]